MFFLFLLLHVVLLQYLRTSSLYQEGINHNDNNLLHTIIDSRYKAEVLAFIFNY